MKKTNDDGLRAVCLGIGDGYEQGELSSGITWDDPRLNNLYDAGANVGEALRALHKAVKKLRKAVLQK